MVEDRAMLIIVSIWLLIALVACSGQSDAAFVNQAQAAASEDALAVSTVIETTSDIMASDSTNLSAGKESVAEATITNSADHEDAQDYVWEVTTQPAEDNDVLTEIMLGEGDINVEGEGVTVDSQTVTITSAGSYSLSGSLTDGQIVVDTQDEETVYLILNGVEITNNSTSPIYVANAEKTIIVLAENSDNYVADGTTYVFEDAEEDEPNAAIFSKDDLTIYGEGSLTVEANYNDGIASKDGLLIAGGTIFVNAADDGIRGKDYLIVKDSNNIIVTAQGDGLKSDEDEDVEKGYIMIESGSVDITSGGDAIQAATDVLISGGEFTITSGGGSSAYIDAETSAKGIKGSVNVIIDGGTFTINSADDAVHSNDNMVINNGIFLIATADDGFHSDATLEFNDGTVQIAESYEGIESAIITINDGEFNIVSSDDGINVAGGNDGSGFGRGPGGGMGPGGGQQRPGAETAPGGELDPGGGQQMPGGGMAPGGEFDPGGGQQMPGGGPGQDAFNTSGDYYLYINGGTIVVDAAGDGIDSNGPFEMTDGLVIVNGPTENMNGALDVVAGFNISGGYLVAAGSAGMAETADASSTQNALLMNFNGTLPGGTLIHIEDSSGNNVLTFAPAKAYQSIAFSSPQLTVGVTYTVYYGGSASSSPYNGLYMDGTYSDGTELGSFTVSDTITMIGNTGRR